MEPQSYEGGCASYPWCCYILVDPPVPSLVLTVTTNGGRDGAEGAMEHTCGLFAPQNVYPVPL